MHPGILARQVQDELSLYKETNKISSKSTTNYIERGSNLKWKLPAWPYVRVNFDAAFQKEEGRMGLSAIVRDSIGNVQAVVTGPKDHISSAAQAESVALLRAMDLCIELGFNQVCFEGDVKAIVDAVNTKGEDNSWIGQMIEDMQLLLRMNQAWSLRFVQRTVNRVAHMTAKLAITDSCEKCLGSRMALPRS
ncbi:hypothetical protein F2P56_030363 [Juglans regia]|uniref:RNase H type-1 domain-containing protein n=2 Tax=Juglans regia TaxID=51240 RepID=A0A833U3X4_JUGRE|nr:uncharacterized protein LOC109006533 [Juglans regia]KAF5449973.1 hypothetical protein F2P56_030363 [Juglans regia]